MINFLGGLKSLEQWVGIYINKRQFSYHGEPLLVVKTHQNLEYGARLEINVIYNVDCYCNRCYW